MSDKEAETKSTILAAIKNHLESLEADATIQSDLYTKNTPLKLQEEKPKNEIFYRSLLKEYPPEVAQDLNALVRARRFNLRR